MIGVFDSGYGGLTVLKAFFRELPNYDYAYLGDNARTPYGNKSQDVIYEYTRQAAEFLFSRGCEIIIVACNTASARALRRLQKEWLNEHYPDRRVLGVLIPVAETAAKESRYGRIGIIATRATIESRAYEKELEKIRPDLEIFTAAAPLLVPLVEEGWAGKPETNMILKKYLRPLKEKKIDTLILGCTHYPFLKKDVRRIMGKNCRVLDTPKIVAAKLKDYLVRHPEIETKLTRSGKRFFYTTDEAARFKSFGQKFIGGNIDLVEKIELG
jgi:glutamate racemase